MDEQQRNRLITPRAFAALAIVELVVIVAALGWYRYSRDVPEMVVDVQYVGGSLDTGSAADLPWPEQGQGAVALEGFGTVAAFGTELGARPIASTTKMMTALLILESHQVSAASPGAVVAIGPEHEDAFLAAIMNDESAVEVWAGEDLTLYQLLEGLLVASANNYAVILAEWDSGSVDAFVQRMNAKAAELGMKDTRFVDASGLLPGNVSTPADLLLLAEAAMEYETFREIVAKPEVTLPVVGTVSTTNRLIGRNGVIGIKTGDTDEAGSCLVFAAMVPTAAGERLLTGVILGQPDRPQVFEASAALIEATGEGVRRVAVIETGEPVGTITTEWGDSAQIVVSEDVAAEVWAGDEISTSLNLEEIETPVADGDVVGSIEVTARGVTTSVDVEVEGSVGAPGFWWRMLEN